MLSISNYKKSYHQETILEISELNLDRGIYWIKGDNGAGKSTLFKSLSGIIPFEGDCEIDGISLKKNPVAYRGLINYSEAEPMFPEFLTQKDLITIIAHSKKVKQNQIKELLSLFGTTDYYDQSVGSYSSGMLKKVGLIMAFLGSPKIILLDEPFTTIDQNSAGQLNQLILDYYRLGTSFLISSHTTDGMNKLPISDTFHINNKGLSIVT